jgi:hypothetical protein
MSEMVARPISSQAACDRTRDIAYTRSEHTYVSRDDPGPTWLVKVDHPTLASAGAILITGPGSAKTELSSYIQHAHPDLARRVCGVETVDHPTDGQLLALARSFFEKDDRMHSQISR